MAPMATTTTAVEVDTMSADVLSKLHLVPNEDAETIAKKHNMPYQPGYYQSLPTSSRVHENSIAELTKEGYKYMHLLPVSPSGIHPPLVEFEHVDVASKADPAMVNLLNVPGATVKEMTPPVGTEVHGIQLTEMTNAQRDELALFVAKRGVVVFRDQNLKDTDPAKLVEFGEYFGPLHTHQFGDYVKGYPGLIAVYRDSYKKLADSHVVGNLSSVSWHTDMSYEINTVGTTFLAHISGPESGGDTIYASTTAAYKKLSPTMQGFLDGLQCIHSGVAQFAKAKAATGLIRDTIETVHPVVRCHPVTGEKALWVNPTYTKAIVGLKQEESDALLNMLFNHIKMGQDFHLRVHWEEGTVVAYDNRLTQHTALLDFETGPGIRRHLLRITPHAERPRF